MIFHILYQVGVTRREANVQLTETDFDERRNVNRRKRWINEGKDPEVEEKRQKQAQQEKRKAIRKEQKRKNRLRKHNETKDKIQLQEESQYKFGSIIVH